MENNSRTILSDTWLKPIIGLVEERDFEEAYALAEYLPVTPGRRLVQCAALLGQKKVAEADEILQELPVKMPEVSADLTTILGKDGFDLLEVGLKAIRDKYLDLGHLCLESHLYTHPKSVKSVVDAMVELASQAFKADNSDLSWGCLERAIELDDSPSRLIQYAEASLAFRPFQSYQAQYPVNSVAFSPDGQFIISGNNDQTVRLWDCQGKALGVFQAQYPVNSVAFSPDGQFIISGSNDQTVRLWDCQGNLLSQPFPRYQGYVNSVAFSPDGQFIISGGNVGWVEKQGNLGLWNLQGNWVGMQPELPQFLSKLAKDLTNRALRELSREDLENRLKIGKLLAIDAETFGTARDLLRQLLQEHPSVSTQISDCLLPLVEYKLNFAQISDFLLEVDPENVVLLTERLIKAYQKWHQPSHLEKLESYAQRLVGIYLSPDISLEAAQALIENKTENYELVKLFLEQTLEREPQQRAKVLAAYIRLCKLAEVRKQAERREEFLTKTVNLSTNVLFWEFFNYARYWMYREAVEVDDKENRWIIRESFPSERRLALYALLYQYSQISTEQLALRLELLFETDLKLTEADVEEIRSKIVQLPPDLQNKIHERISEQTMVPFDVALDAENQLIILERFESDRENRFRRENLLESLESASESMAKAYRGIPLLRVGESISESIQKLLNKPGYSTVKVERHTRVDFPSECVLEREVELRIQLTKDVPKLTRVLKKVIFSVRPGVEKVTLDVNVTAPGFKMQQWHKPMILPINGDSEEITFTLTPLELGEQVIEIEFFHEASRVGYVLVQTNVLRWLYSDTQTPSKVLSMEDVIDVEKNLSTRSVNIDKRTLHVSWSERDSKIYYTIRSKNSEEVGEWEHNGINNLEQIEDYLRELNAFLIEIVSIAQPTEGEWQDMCSKLQQVGENLFNTLIPSPLRERVQQWERDSSVVISTNEQWIPWELMYDGEDFWGQKFIIVRYPRLNDRRRIPDASRLQSPELRQIRRVINIVGGGWKDPVIQQAINLFQKIPSTLSVELLQEKSRSELEQTIPGADALHYTCHGRLQPYMLQIAQNREQEENLLPEIVGELPLEPGSFVFANACSSSVPILTFGKFNSFGWEFYRQGADVFVGTLGAVPVRYALSFANSVYEELFKQKTIGEAVATAKQVAAREHNLFWLLYCIYGDPDFFINLEESEER